MKKIIVDKSIAQLIISEYLDGASLNELSLKYHYTRAKIKTILLDNNIILHSKKEIVKLLQDKGKKTILKKYGVKNVFQLEDIKNKSRKTCLEKYGTEFASQSAQIKNKVKQTCLSHYGVENPLQSDIVKDKVHKTCKTNWGGDWTSSKPGTVEKIKRTKYERYGSENYNNLIQAQKTCLEKYGVEYNVLTESCKQSCKSKNTIEKRKNKYKITCIERYGVEHYFQTDEFRTKARKLYVYDNEHFDSFPELAIWVYAKENNISIKRCPIKIEYEYNNKKHYYFPDFLYNNILLEIKGDHLFNWMQEKDTLENAKYNCMLDNNVTIWTSKDYQFAIDYCNKIKFDKNKYLVRKDKLK